MPYAIRIDMRLTDDRVLSVIREQIGIEPGKVSLQTIASRVGCTKLTAFRAVKRLKNAGRLHSVNQGYAKPCIYQVMDE